MDIKEFCVKAENYSGAHPELRKGQAYFNLAINLFGVKNMRHIYNSPSDPYFKEDNMDRFLEKINELLEVL